MIESRVLSSLLGYSGGESNKACLSMLNDGVLTDRVNETLIVFILKKDRPQTIAYLCLFVLSNVLYKIVSMTIDNILKKITPSLF